MVIMLISCHVPRQLVYPAGQKRHLDFSRTGITITESILIYDFGLRCLFQIWFPFSPRPQPSLKLFYTYKIENYITTP